MGHPQQLKPVPVCDFAETERTRYDVLHMETSSC